MKEGGSSLNGNTNAKGGLKQNRKKCAVCNRSYGQEWTKDNHEKNCRARRRRF